MNKYPGKECGLDEEEWELEQIVDRIKSLPTLEAIEVLRKEKIVFAQFHVQTALEAASEKTKIKMNANSSYLDIRSIFDSYPLDKIK